MNVVFNMLAAGVTCLKHEGFLEEREWRVIYWPQRSLSPLMESSIEVVGGIPQTVYKLPLDREKSDVLADLQSGAAVRPADNRTFAVFLAYV